MKISKKKGGKGSRKPCYVLLQLIFLLSTSTYAFADACGKALTGPFVDAQARKLCAYFINTASLSTSLTFTGSGPIIAPTQLSLAVGAATTPNYTFDNVKVSGPTTMVLAASTAVHIAAGAANTPSAKFQSGTSGGLNFPIAGYGLGFTAYVPTPALTPAAGTNDLKIGLNVFPTAAANAGALLPASPTAGDVIDIVNSGPNTVQVWPGSGDTINQGTANQHVGVTTLLSVRCVALSAAAWNCAQPAAINTPFT